jgi:cardiolipin synthase A/B
VVRVTEWLLLSDSAAQRGLWIALGWGLHSFCFLMVCVHCLRTRREATSALLWMFLAWSFPVVGPFLYLTLGVDRLPDKGLRKLLADREFLAARRARTGADLPLAFWQQLRQAMVTTPSDPAARALSGAMDGILRNHPLLGGNQVTALVTGDEAYPAMQAAIEAATDHIHLQSFIIRNDNTGRHFLNTLLKKAHHGVRVRILYDRFGSTHAVLHGFFRRYRHKPNLQIVGWTQVNPLRRRFQLNLRNHRKLLVVDGKHAFCGGINLHDENVGSPARQPIRDYHFEIRGPFVHELQFSFMQDWYFMTREDPAALLCASCFPSVPPAGSAQIRLANSGPTSSMETIADIFFMAVTQATRQLLIVTPYFAPPRDIVRALRCAALRGVDVRLILPLRNNHVYAGLAGRSLYEELLEAGVHIFERHPPFIHAKALIVDDAMAIVGTANWDVRSLRLNYETNLVMHDENLINALKRIVLDDEARSRQVDLAAWRRRPRSARIAENLCALLTPAL